MKEIVFQSRSLVRRFGAFTAVDDMNVELKKGDIFALVGQNGAGKTTLLKMICGLTPPTSGSMELFGYSGTKELGRARRRIGSIIETPGFYPYLSACQNLEYYRIQRGIGKKNCVEEALHFVGLDTVGNKKFKSFSLGMKQRLGLALAILNDPDFLVLDEPINGLDPVGIREFREILLKLNHEKETTILVSSHILGELSQIATRYGFISGGRLVECLTAEELEMKCRVTLKLEVDNSAKAAAVLTDRFSMKQIEILDETTLLLSEGLDRPEFVVKALVESGILVSQAYRTGANLENYFIDLIGGKQIA
ncbi:Vitamin B12 import ATP-binding protein BtuD [Caprobacter fermentans]|uniref:ABC transporter ATP-binding protein n=1 Tax=Caproicibacter fermentans TaxID=2576756 RepID=A0A6N8I0V1_9FIRM|nr:ABC transporter ATP-binding protein [Caproicibacter fermentans]MVB11548.1 Vitamin B12 import ATP-binding protein BtuD [Caproicibacter fermentans]OCN02742.1 bacitracin ABC transporter ATP-binding protein [Clostridium sp. W14A]QNK41063.1 ABC transporter ATP-binding protein [Caproicibacter fermentans]